MWSTKMFLSILLGALFASLCHGEVVELTDATFEHQTQASTGATTGSWFILFATPSCPHCTAIKPVFEELGQETELYENSIVLGKVDVSVNIQVAKRFNIKSIPTLIYIHKGSIYRFDGVRHLEGLKSFVLGDYEKVEAEPIPVPSSFIDELKDLVQGNQMVGVGIVAMGLLLLLTIGVLVSTLSKSGKKNKRE